jgi:para-aminobenzoate synthetase/4-amino-4-deoxychorismate lyase
LRIAIAPRANGELEMTIERRQAPAAGVVSLRALRVPGGLGAHKWVDRSLLDEAQAGLPADTLTLLVDADGSVLEASRANVFAVLKGRLLTPPTDGRILPGVTRMRVLEIAAAMGIETGETALSTDDLLGADEVFLSGSVRGIEPVDALDGIALPTGGETGSTIAAELWESWKPVQVG